MKPPPITAACPLCGQLVDTTCAYPVLPNYPPPFAKLRATWNSFRPRYEDDRQNPDDVLSKVNLESLPDELNSRDGLEWLKQRMFYRSTICFYRAFNLFLATLVLQRRAFQTWAEVTAYYSRFYIIQSLLNIFLIGFFRPNKDILIYYTGEQSIVLTKHKWPGPLKTAGPHERWWYLMETLKHPSDYPFQHLGVVLSRACYEPNQRNTLNYDFTYIWGGFPELDWFDCDVANMMGHYGPEERVDRDITDGRRFYQNTGADYVDGSEFWDDDIQMVWLSIKTYLELLRGLDISSEFITTAKIAALVEVHLVRDYPEIARGILMETTKLLNDGYDYNAELGRMGMGLPYTFFRD